jgi:hypothetical protein
MRGRLIIKGLVLLSFLFISPWVKGVAPTKVEIKVNGDSREVMAQGEKWSVEWTLSKVGGRSIWMWYIDINKNKTLDKMDRKILPEPLSITDGVWREDSLSDADRKKNGKVTLRIERGFFILPLAQCLIAVWDEDGSYAYDWIEVKPDREREWFSIGGNISPIIKDIVVGAISPEPLIIYSVGISNSEGKYRINLPPTMATYEVSALTSLSENFLLRQEELKERVTVSPRRPHVEKINFIYVNVNTRLGEIKGEVYIVDEAPSLSYPVIINIGSLRGIHIHTFSTLTNLESGEYSLKLPVGEYEVRIDTSLASFIQEDYIIQPERRKVEVIRGRVIEDVNFLLNLRNSKIHGRVISQPTGTPVRGVKILLEQKIEPGMWQLLPYLGVDTDDTGYYSIRVCDGDWRFRWDKNSFPEGYKLPEIEPFTLRDYQEIEINIELIPEESHLAIKGKVINADTGKGVPKVEIMALEEESEERATTFTDSEGNYQFFLPSGNYMVKAIPSPSGIIENNSQEVKIIPGKVATVDFIFNYLNSRIYGQVIDKETYQPIKELYIKLKKLLRNLPGRPLVQATSTDAGGYYSIQVCDGEWKFDWSALPGKYKVPNISPIVIGDNEEIKVNIELEKMPFGSLIRGRVTTDEGRGIENVEVVAFLSGERPYRGITDPRGFYQIPLPNGRYLVYVGEKMNFLERGLIIPFEKEISLMNEEREINFKFYRCESRIYGKIAPIEALVEKKTTVVALRKSPERKDGDGKMQYSLAGNRVYVEKYISGEVWVGYGWKVENGEYLIRLPHGEWQLEIWDLDPSYPPPQSVKITLQKGERRKYDFNLLSIDFPKDLVSQKLLPYPNPNYSFSRLPWRNFSEPIKIYNILGQLVSEFQNNVFTGYDFKGQRLPAGVYYYTVSSPKNFPARGIIVIR